MATIIGYGSKHSHEFKLVVNEISTDVINNTSEVSFEFTLYKSSYSWSGWNSITYKVIINGTEYTGTIPSYTKGTTLTIKSGTQKISHNDDGKKSIDCSFSVTDNSGQSYTCGNASASGTVELSTIPRASSVSCTTANIEETAMIIINRSSSNFKHTLMYEYGNLSDTIATKTSETNIGWVIPEAFYSQIPNNKIGVGTLWCITYSGDTEIGRSATVFYVSTNEEKCKPSISATVIDTNSETIALTGSNEKLIKYKSTAKITITASAKNSASIGSKKVNNINVEGNNISIKEVENDTFVVTVTDSRGYSNSVTLKPSMINYIPLSINATVKRTQPTTGEVDVSFSGNYFNGSFGNTDNELSMKWFYKENGASEWIEGGNISATIKDNTYSNGTSKISLGKIFDYQKSYEIYLEVADKLITSKSQHSITQGIPIFNWGKDYFNVNGKILLNGENIAGTVLYENEKGAQDTITLNESISNFNFIAIIDNFKKVHLLSAIKGTVDIETFKIANSTTFRHFCASLDISDDTITWNGQYFYDQNAYQQEYAGMSIVKVLGYR